MISITDPNVLSFAQAAELLPRDGQGRKVAPITLKKWSTRGANGAILESVRMGRSWYTTRDALTRFCLEQANANAKAKSPTPVPSSVADQADRECRKLEAMGL